MNQIVSTVVNILHSLFAEFARAWGKSVLSEFAKYCASNGVKFQDLHRVGTTFFGYFLENCHVSNVCHIAIAALNIAHAFQ